MFCNSVDHNLSSARQYQQSRDVLRWPWVRHFHQMYLYTHLLVLAAVYQCLHNAHCSVFSDLYYIATSVGGVTLISQLSPSHLTRGKILIPSVSPLLYFRMFCIHIRFHVLLVTLAFRILSQQTSVPTWLGRDVVMDGSIMFWTHLFMKIRLLFCF